MKRPLVIAAALGAAFLPLVLPVAARAQTGTNPQCASGANGNSRYTADACQKASDLFQYIAPQLGVAVAGGNAVLGQGGTLGGLGHVYVSLRANVLSGRVPQIDAVAPSISGPRADTFPTNRQLIALPIADVVVGLFRGIPLGVTNVGGLDLLVNATYLPALTTGGVQLREPNGSIKLGIGARLGILQESLLVPGVSATFVRRQLPEIQVIAPSGGDTLRVDNANVRADSWRLVVSKTLFIVALAAGAGQDRYHSTATVSAYVAPRVLDPSGPVVSPASSAGPVPFGQDVTRTTYFGDATLNILPIVKLIGEIGRASGGAVQTYNTFQGDTPNAARVFGSLGLRIGF